MTQLQFWASTISSLAWPTALVVAVITLRTIISRMAERVTTVKWRDAEARLQIATTGLTANDIRDTVARVLAETHPDASDATGELVSELLDREAEARQRRVDRAWAVTLELPAGMSDEDMQAALADAKATAQSTFEQIMRNRSQRNNRSDP